MPKLTALATSENKDVRAGAVMALASIAPDDAGVQACVAAAAEDKNSDVRLAAVAALGHSGAAAGPARAGHASVLLPGLAKPGSYHVRATFAGAKLLANAAASAELVSQEAVQAASPKQLETLSAILGQLAGMNASNS